MASPPPPPKIDRSDSNAESVTAQDYINSQLQLESDAREVLPYSFDTCTRDLGRLRQPVYACRTCTPRNPSTPPHFGESKEDGAAALCYSCSISCHGDHELVEIFEKRGVRCDCGTQRIPGVPCGLRKVTDETVGDEVVKYGQNYWGRFCTCEVDYQPEKESGTMYQCFLGDVCGEDWFHDTCIVGQKPPRYDRVNDEGKGEGREVEVVTEESGTEPNEKDGQLPEADPDTTMKEIATEGLANKAAINESVGDTVSGEATESNGHRPEDTKMEGTTQKGATNGANSTTEAGSAVEEEDDDDEDEPPAGIPKEEFEHFICWACVEKNSWLKRYAGTPGFLPGAQHKDATAESAINGSAQDSSIPAPAGNDSAISEEQQPADTVLTTDRKRKASAEPEPSSPKRAKTPDALKTLQSATTASTTECKFTTLPASLPGPTSLFLHADFRQHLCRCPACFPLLARHHCLLEEEETYSPPLESDHGGSVHSGSTLERGERALGMVDRVRAIEGVMAYNHLKEKVKAFLKPYAESGQAVGAEDVKAYFEKLRGDGKEKEKSEEGGAEGVKGDTRKEGEGY